MRTCRSPVASYISNPSEKGALLGTITSTVTSTATIVFTGYVRTTGEAGDHVSATAYLISRT